MNIKGQVTLVSGAGSEQGIGMAIARRLGQAGARVLVTASSARIEQRAAELRQEGIEARAWVADLTDEQLVSAGITPGMVRLSVGIENIKDILADLEQALAKA